MKAILTLRDEDGEFLEIPITVAPPQFSGGQDDDNFEHNNIFNQVETEAIIYLVRERMLERYDLPDPRHVCEICAGATCEGVDPNDDFNRCYAQIEQRRISDQESLAEDRAEDRLAQALNG